MTFYKFLIAGTFLSFAFVLVLPRVSNASEVKLKNLKKVVDTTVEFIPSIPSDFEKKLIKNSSKFRKKEKKVYNSYSIVNQKVQEIYKQIDYDRGLPLKIAEESFRQKRRFAADIHSHKLTPSKISI